MYKHTLNFVLLSFVIFLPSFSLALDPNRAVTQYVHNFWDTDDGLPNNTINSILQTRDGYLWIGTSSGLARFDGVQFVTFDATNTKEIQAPEIYPLLESPDGTLWIGTYWGGLISYKDGKFLKYGKEKGLLDERVVCMYRDVAGNLWLGTPTGLFKMRDGKFTKYWKNEGLPGNVVWEITQDQSGILWIATVGGGLYQHNKGKFLKFPEVDEKDVLSLLADKNKTLWVGTDAGLFRIQNEKVKKYTTENGLTGDVIEALFHDRDGNIWIGTNAGLTRFQNEVMQNLTSKHGLPVDEVRSLYEDREGNLWLGTSGGGLSRLLDGKLITFSKDEGLDDDAIASVHGNKNGDVWLATNVGISRLRNGKVENFPLDPQHSQWHAWTILEDSKGTVWVGTGGAGLLRLEKGKIQPFSLTQNLLSKTIWGLYEDRNGSIWASNFGYGVNQLENGKLKETFTTEKGLSSSYTQATYEDKDGSLIVLTEDGGVNRYKDGKFSVYIPQDLLQHQVFTIYRDQEGVLWMGSYGGGLKRYHNGKIVSIRRTNGLFEDFVGNILEDSKGIFWISAAKGIFSVSKKELNDFAAGKISSVRCNVYGKSDGMKSVECSAGYQPAAWKSPDGKLWFPTVKGVVMIDPESLKKNQIEPPVYIDEIIVDRKSFGPASLTKIELDPGKEKFEFRYTGLSFMDPKKVQFKYKLEGFDKDWVDAGTRRTAYYTNIPPRHYKFRVIASNNDGVWNEKGASASFYLKPYFYQTSWFYILCGITVLFVGSGLHRTRLKKVSAEFKAVIAERSRIAREIHDGLAQSLAGIVMQLETAQLIPSQEKSQRHLVRALELARDGVQDARRAIGDLHPTPLEAQDFPFALRSMIQHQLQDTNISFRFDLTGTPIAIPVNVQSELLRICQESTQNAIKHSQAKNLRVKMNYENESLRVSIQDDGHGFDTNATPPAGHYGLNGMRERSAQLGADLSIQSSPGKGTLVQILISHLNSKPL